jgi:putative spermidine/putrescine transport system substrate-binding protein
MVMQQKISRRFFLTSAVIITLSQLLSGCSNSVESLKILLLENSIPTQLIGDFRKAINNGNYLNFEASSQLLEILNLLQKWQKFPDSIQKTNLLDKILGRNTNNTIDLATLGDSWLQTAITQKIIQPMTLKKLDNWEKLPTFWQELVRRNDRGELAADGQIWGAPYRWGSVVIAYRSDKLDKLGWTPTDWSDLWREELRDRLSLLDSPRETIGLTLKKLGYSYNTPDLTSVPNLEAELSALHQQAKLYSSDRYLQPLILGDTWVAVGWSTDIIPITERRSYIKYAIPKSGTSLWADLWVQPQLPASLASDRDTVADNKDLLESLEQWISFCWTFKAAQQISLFTSGVSPVFWNLKPEKLPSNLQNNTFLTSEALSAEKSEFLLPVTAQTQEQYKSLWLKIRQATS